MPAFEQDIQMVELRDKRLKSAAEIRSLINLAKKARNKGDPSAVDVMYFLLCEIEPHLNKIMGE